MFGIKLLLPSFLIATTFGKINFVEENGFEHPNHSIDGFVLNSVFTHHAHRLLTATSEIIEHTVTRRKLQFNKNRHLVSHATTNSTLPKPFNNMQAEFMSLSVTPELTRNKVRALAKLTFLNAGGAMDWDKYKYIDLPNIEVTDDMSGKDVLYTDQ
mgnify:CR=1 FL=1|tara:strand:- start:1552 stop:2019 length:468 start_codon:yes stop_codon:yes gene_type:complete